MSTFLPNHKEWLKVHHEGYRVNVKTILPIFLPHCGEILSRAQAHSGSLEELNHQYLEKPRATFQQKSRMSVK